MALATEQYLLLNNLMYMDSSHFPLEAASEYQGRTVGQWLAKINTSGLLDDMDYGSYMTGRDWKNLIAAVQADSTLCSMTIETTHIDMAEGGGGGYSALFRSESTGEAVVVFRGTATGEWKDNFTGGNVTDTAQQKNALEWYQQVYQEYHLKDYEVSVTGHSKGGNKSKYITIQDNTVDHCISFDGQGFSDQFVNKYRYKIAERQYKIHNHNVDEDYVNLLLNDVGEKAYYKAREIGRGGFLENHCPNTFLEFQDDGSYSMTVNPRGQDQKMKALDEFFNGYLRSLSDDERSETLEMVNMFLDKAFQVEGKTTQEGIDLFREVVTSPKYSDDFARLLAYTIKYGQENPEMYERVKVVLTEIGLKDYNQYADIVETVLNYRIDIGFVHLSFNDLFSLAMEAAEAGSVALDVIHMVNPLFTLDSETVLRELCELIKKKTGYEMSPQELRKLLKIVKQVSTELKMVEINYNGSDIRVPSSQTQNDSGGNHTFRCVPSSLKQGEGDLRKNARKLDTIAEELEKEAGGLGVSIKGARDIQTRVLAAKKMLNQCSRQLDEVAGVLLEVSKLYETAERKNTVIRY